jgi:anti-repressor protein
MVNATEMARPFGKRAAEWLRLPSTIQFMSALEAMGKSHRSQLIVTENGVGTWLHEDVAIEFARWLSPSFLIWCNDRIRELMRHGFTANPDKLEELVSNPDLLISLANSLKQERAEKELLYSHNLKLAETIQEQAPRVAFSKAVEESTDSILIGELAKLLYQNGINIGQNRLFEILRRTGYLCEKGELHNTPTQRALQMGLFETKVTTIQKANGAVLVSATTKVTGKGKIYFIKKFMDQTIKV